MSARQSDQFGPCSSWLHRRGAGGVSWCPPPDPCTFWFPSVLFGTLTIASAGFYLTGSGAAVPAWWAVAGTLGGVITGRFYRRRDAEAGRRRPRAPFIGVGSGIAVGAFLLPALTSGNLREVVSHFAVAGGHLGFAVLEHDVRIAAIGSLLAAIPLVILALAPDSAGAVTAAVNGAIMVAFGLVLRGGALKGRPIRRPEAEMARQSPPAHGPH